MPPLRLFLAIKTPPEITPQIAAIRDTLRGSNADVKWESDEKLHATLKFLGNTDEHLLPEIVSYLRGVCRGSNSLLFRYKGVGSFPGGRSPRVIWIGMEDQQGNLDPLQSEIESGLVPFGFEREKKKFHPHVTVGRVKSMKRIESLIRMMESVTFESQPVTVHEIALVRSELTSSGSIYTTLHSIPLAS